MPDTVIALLGSLASSDDAKFSVDPTGDLGIFEPAVEDISQPFSVIPSRIRSAVDDAYSASLSVDFYPAPVPPDTVPVRGDGLPVNDLPVPPIHADHGVPDPLEGLAALFEPPPVDQTHQLVAPTLPLPLSDCQTRTSSGVIRRRNYTHLAKVYNISVKKALVNMRDAATNSIKCELQQLHDKTVWIGLPPSVKSPSKPIMSFMFLKEKFDSQGQFQKLKARLVAGGHMQVTSELLYEQIHSPTASLPHLFIVACLAARDKAHIKTIDIAGAYLNANIASHKIDPILSEFLVDIDPSTYRPLVRNNGKIVVQLQKALYGCVESAKLWYDLLTSSLISDGYAQVPSDPCVFMKDINNRPTYVVVYVDDLFVVSQNMVAIDELESLLRSRFKDITVHSGTIHSYLGMTFDFSKSKSVLITMDGYLQDLLKLSGIPGVCKTPATEHLFQTIDSKLLNVAKKSTFHTLTAKLLYLAKRTRPDILLPVSYLTTRVTEPTEVDWTKLERVIKYLNGTQGLGIRLAPGTPTVIQAYCDASYGTHADGKSHSGLLITLGDGCGVHQAETRHQVFCRV